MSNTKQQIEDLAKLFANRIGSPWGEGGTYEVGKELPEDEDDEFQPNGKLFSHLNDSDFELFVKDLSKAIDRLVTEAEIKARIDEWENIDGDDIHYWDYREVGNATRKIYLSPIERSDELQSQLTKEEEK